MQIVGERVISFKERERRSIEINKKIAESYPMVGGASDDNLWRSLNQISNRDLYILTQKRMQDIAFYLYDSNPIAKRIIEITRDFVIGDGFTYAAEEPVILDLIDEFWNDPDNNLDIELDIDVLELGIFGELCLPVWVNSANGAVKLSYVDPVTILKVVKDKNNPKISRIIRWKPINAKEEKEMDIVNIDKNVNSKTYGLLTGECFFFAINKVSGATRGRSDLLTLCLHPDTLINTLEGDIAIKDLAGRKEILVYSWDEKKNELVVAKATNVRKTRENSSLVKIHFTNGDSIITTPEHPLLLINAKAYREAKDFLPSDRVQALCRKVKDGYVWVQYKKSLWMLEHRFIMEKILGRKLSSEECVHHKNGNTLDNRLENLELMSRAQHANHHIPEVLLTSGIKEKTKKVLSNLMKGNKYALGNRFNLTNKQTEKESIVLKESYKNMNEKQKIELKERNTKASQARFQKGKRINQYVTFNHEVAYVEKLNYTSDVYDMTVEKYSNFSANGILVHNCDWIDGHDQFLFARLERAFLLNTFIWDITCEGMNKGELTEFAKGLTMPKSGSIRAHNEKITWKSETPKLESSDASEEARMFKQQILGGAGYPEHWFGEGSRSNRAVALETSLPTLKKLKSRQKTVKNFIKHIINFVIDQAIIHKRVGFNKDMDRSFKIIPSPIVSRDNKGLMESVGNFVDGLSRAVDKKWISDKDAKRTFNTVLSQMGTDIESRDQEVSEDNNNVGGENKEDNLDEIQ